MTTISIKENELLPEDSQPSWSRPKLGLSVNIQKQVLIDKGPQTAGVESQNCRMLRYLKGL